MLRVLLSLATVLMLSLPAAAINDGPGPRETLLRWSTPALLVRDIDRSAEWYEAHLGFQRVSDRLDGASRSMLLTRGEAFLHLRPLAVVDTTASIETGLATRRHLTLFVTNVDDFVADLQDRGIDVLALPQDEDDGRHRTAAIADPDGNPIVLKEPLPPGT